MFRLEKVFQNDDSGYYLFINFTKSLILFISIYFFSILEKNTIYDLLNNNSFITDKVKSLMNMKEDMIILDNDVNIVKDLLKDNIA